MANTMKALILKKGFKKKSQSDLTFSKRLIQRYIKKLSLNHLHIKMVTNNQIVTLQLTFNNKIQYRNLRYSQLRNLAASTRDNRISSSKAYRCCFKWTTAIKAARLDKVD